MLSQKRTASETVRAFSESMVNWETGLLPLLAGRLGDGTNRDYRSRSGILEIGVVKAGLIARGLLGY